MSRVLTVGISSIIFSFTIIACEKKEEATDHRDAAGASDTSEPSGGPGGGGLGGGGPNDGGTSSTDDTGGAGDTEVSDTTTALYYEDFEGDPKDLEHFYEDWNYYQDLNTLLETEGEDGTGQAIMYNGSSIAAGVYVFAHRERDMDERETFSPDVTFDLSDCESGSVSFTWGFENWSTSGRSGNLHASVGYQGMGEDDSIACTGETTVESDWRDFEDYGPFEVTCPVDYDCGYEAEGTFGLSLSLYYECHDCGDYRNGGLLWIDDVQVDLYP